MLTSITTNIPDVARPAIADLVHQPGHTKGMEVFLLTRINVPEEARGRGYGSHLLRRICEQANREGVVLEVHPTPSGGLNMTELLRWYRRYGFEGHAGQPMIRMPGHWIPKLRDPSPLVPASRTEAKHNLPSCTACGDSGVLAGLEPLLMGNPTEGNTVVGYCCVDCAERFRKLILARYPSLVATLRAMRSIDVVNRPSRTLGGRPRPNPSRVVCLNDRCHLRYLVVPELAPMNCGACGVMLARLLPRPEGQNPVYRCVSMTCVRNRMTRVTSLPENVPLECDNCGKELRELVDNLQVEVSKERQEREV